MFNTHKTTRLNEDWKDGEDTGRALHSTSLPFYVSSILFLFILIPLSVVYAQNNTGKIAGQVIDKRKNQPLAQQKVILQIHRGETEQKRETVTDTSGQYLFDKLPIALDTYYTVSTTYEGQEYVEDDIVLSTWVPELKISIEANAFTTDESKVKIRQHTLVINPPPADHPPDDAVSVMEIIQVENTSDFAFRTVHNGQPVGLFLNLPDGYEELQVAAGLDGAIPNAEQQLVFGLPLASGAQNLAFSYVMHVSESGLDLSRPLTFDTDQLYVYVSERIPLVPQSPTFGAGSRGLIHNFVYTIYPVVEALLAEQELDLRLKRDASALSQAQGEWIAISGVNPRILALIIVAAVCAGGFFVAAVFKIVSAVSKSDESSEDATMPKAAPDASWLRKLNAADLEKTRLARLELVTHLEEMYEKKEISERVYNRLRKEQADRLAAVLEQIQNL